MPTPCAIKFYRLSHRGERNLFTGSISPKPGEGDLEKVAFLAPTKNEIHFWTKQNIVGGPENYPEARAQTRPYPTATQEVFGYAIGCEFSRG